ncbi:MAG: hypothetical protein PHR82_00735 [Endomicrobiaceae bacterium]|nr:hypothetical protein [Endomicrobiaceae bacterium]
MDKIIEILINHFLKYQFVYVFLFISLIFTILAIFTKKKTLKLVFLVIFSLFITMGLTEFILSSKIKNLKDFVDYPEGLFCLEAKSIYQTRQIHIVDQSGQKRKYENRPANTNEIVLYDVVYSQYLNGFRYTRCNLNSDTNYVFLGCSFAFGDGLNDNQTLPYYFSKLMNFENNVLNCGMSGRSTNMVINILESDIINNFISENSKTKYFIYSLIDDHMPRNFRISCYREFPKDNWLYKNGKWKRVSQPFGILKVMFARSYIFNKIFLDFIEKHNMPYYEEYMIKSLQRIKEIAEIKYKSKLIIVLGRCCQQNLLFLNEIKKTDLDLVFLPEAFDSIEYKIKKDGHPSAKANEELANILISHIQNNESGQK